MNTQNPYAAPRAAVTDIVDPNAEVELAGRGVRLGAALLDGIILDLAFIPLLFGITLPTTPEDLMPKFAVGGIIGTLVLLVAWIVVTCMLVASNGQTIAKRLLGIKVIRTDGSKASLGRIFWLRNFVNILLGFVPMYALIDALLIFGEPRQCVHDKIADTNVVVA